MLDTGTFTDLQVFGNTFMGGELIVSELEVITDITVSGVASITSVLTAPGIIAESGNDPYSGNDPFFAADPFVYLYGQTYFAGTVDFSSAVVAGLPEQEVEGPKHHAARVLASGQVAYNSGGFSSIGVTTAGDNVYEYVFAEPIMGAEYSVVATSNFNGGNIHCNVLNLNSFGFTIETGRNSAKPEECAHSVQVTYN